MQRKTVRIIVDRPKGSHHPKFEDIIYPVNYGYVEGVFAGDGEEQDAYILGVDIPLKTFDGCVIAIIHRKNDVEDKWVAAPCGMSFSPEKIAQLVDFQEKYFDTEIVMLDE